MAEKKSVSKTSSRAKVNASKSTKTAVKVGAAVTGVAVAKSVKKTGLKGLLVALLCLIIGAGVGLGAYFIVCRNDTFEIIGKDEITITIDDVYQDKGVKVIEFGKDVSDKVVVETNLVLDGEGKPTQEGTFYFKYTVDSLKYGKIFKIQKIRLVSVVGSGEGGE